MSVTKKFFQNGLYVFGVSIVLTACGGDPWTGAEKDRLVDRCREEGGSRSYCKCYLKNAMESYPNADDVEELDFESAVELSIGCE